MTARQCLEHEWLRATSAEMEVCLPTDNKAAVIANEMVPPTNWNPVRHSSLGKAASPTGSRPVSAPSTPHASACDDDQHSVFDVTLDTGGGGRTGKCDEDQSVMNACTVLCDDGLGKTAEEMCVDCSAYSAAVCRSGNCHSVEVPVKKAKCVRGESSSSQALCALCGQETAGTGGCLLNGISVSSDVGTSDWLCSGSCDAKPPTFN